jgi:transcriptional regulator with XRE-family HTH domain
VRLDRADLFRERRKLSDQLKELRRSSKLSGAELASRLGWAQSKISRTENAKQLPSEEDIRGWVRVTEAPTEILIELLAMLHRAQSEYVGFREQYRAAGGLSGLQSDIRVLESQAARIFHFQPALIPALLQTADYAREMLHLPSGPLLHGSTENDIAGIVAVRVQRQQALYQAEKKIYVVLLEGALRCRLCTPATLLGQLDRLVVLLGLPSLELGIIPFTTQMPVYPLSGFDLYDNDVLSVETVIGETWINDPAEVAKYLKVFEMLQGAASFGDDAAVIIQGVARELREELQSPGSGS